MFIIYVYICIQDYVTVCVTENFYLAAHCCIVAQTAITTHIVAGDLSRSNSTEKNEFSMRINPYNIYAVFLRCQNCGTR